MAHLGKGKTEAALKSYQGVLRIDPRDIRIRQKIADLYLQLGKKPEAMRQMREVAIGHIGEDQHRQALVVLKQLQKLKPKDDEVYGLMGDCYTAEGFIPDAREAYEKTLELLETKPKEGLPYAAKLMAIAPGEMLPKVNHAELLQRSGKLEDAAAAWKALGMEARRRGNSADQTAFNERALRLDEGDLECLEGAAEARIQLGEPKEALVHIQKAYTASPSSERVLSMLAQCFELMDQKPKAKKVLQQLAKLYEDMNEPIGRRDALQRAFACEPEDVELSDLVGAAVARAERCEMRLTDHKWSEAKDEAVGQVVVEAEVLARYGFADRAKEVIENSPPEVRQSLAARARLVETLTELGNLNGALEELSALEVVAAEDTVVLNAVRTRAGALKGDFDEAEADALPPAEAELEAEEVVELELEIEDEDEEEDDAAPVAAEGSVEARADALAAAGAIEAAVAAYQEVLTRDPGNTDVLTKLGALVAGDEEDAPPEAEEPFDLPAEALSPVAQEAEVVSDMPDFQSIFAEQGAQPTAGPPAAAPDPTSAIAGDEVAVEARALLLVGLYDEVIEQVKDQQDLVSAVMCAEARSRLGDPAKARKSLRRALDDASEKDPGHPEALWVLACLQAVTGKGKAAGRTLDDLEDLELGYRSVEIAALRRGIAVLKGR